MIKLGILVKTHFRFLYFMNEENKTYILLFSINKVIFIIQNKFLNNKYKI